MVSTTFDWIRHLTRGDGAYLLLNQEVNSEDWKKHGSQNKLWTCKWNRAKGRIFICYVVIAQAVLVAVKGTLSFLLEKGLKLGGSPRINLRGRREVS